MPEPDHQLTEADLEQLQSELTAMVVAWADRGISPLLAVWIMSGFSHSALAQFGESKAELIERLEKMWQKHGGKQ